MKKHEIKVSEVIEAARKNGYAWGKGSPYPGFDKFCVLAQTAMNLNLSVDYWGMLSSALDNLIFGADFGGAIYRYNDGKAESYEDAFHFLEEVLTPYKDQTILIGAPNYNDET